jgi:hypothetical protein
MSVPTRFPVSLLKVRQLLPAQQRDRSDSGRARRLFKIALREQCRNRFSPGMTES